MYSSESPIMRAIEDHIMELQFLIQDAYSIYDYLKLIETNHLARSLSLRYPIIDKLFYPFMMTLSVDLIKIYKKSEDYSLERLLRIVIRDRHSISWHSKPTKEELHVILNSIIKVRDSEEFKSVLNARNKQYSHLDKNRFNVDTRLELPALNWLLISAQRILNQIKLPLHHVTNITQEGHGIEMHLLLNELTILDELRNTIKSANDAKSYSEVLKKCTGILNTSYFLEI